MLCRQCGFDSSRDYTKYPTFGSVGRTPSVSTLRRQWQSKQNPPAPKPVTAPAAPPKPAPQKTTAPKQAKPAAPVQKAAAVSIPPNKAFSKNKWVAFFLCLLLGMFGAHKFYEGKIVMGIVYLCTAGLFGYGWLFDCIVLLFKPNPYYP